jgi:hypothetical protein
VSDPNGAGWERVTRLPTFPRLVLHAAPMPEQVDQYETGTVRVRPRRLASRQVTMPRRLSDHWSIDAPCGADPELFDPPRHGPLPQRVLDAIAICRACPVIVQCRQDQHESPTAGIRAGIVYRGDSHGKVRRTRLGLPWPAEYKPHEPPARRQARRIWPVVFDDPEADALEPEPTAEPAPRLPDPLITRVVARNVAKILAAADNRDAVEVHRLMTRVRAGYPSSAACDEGR